jgi:hypothetical protein
MMHTVVHMAYLTGRGGARTGNVNTPYQSSDKALGGLSMSTTNPKVRDRSYLTAHRHTVNAVNNAWLHRVCCA